MRGCTVGSAQQSYGFAMVLGMFANSPVAKMARVGWNGEGMHIEMQRPDEHSKMTRPYIFMKTADGDLVPWVASQSDLLAMDWVVVGEE